MAACPVGPEPSGPGLHRTHSFLSRNSRIRSSEAGRMALFALHQLILNAPKLLQRSLQSLHDFSRQDRWIGAAVGVLKALVLESEDVQVGLIRSISI